MLSAWDAGWHEERGRWWRSEQEESCGNERANGRVEGGEACAQWQVNAPAVGSVLAPYNDVQPHHLARDRR